MSQGLTKEVTPEGVIFPISAFLLKSAADYNASLEAFSQQLIPFLESRLNEEGRMTIHK